MVESAATTCPTLETLAAFIDGRLEPTERAEVVGHLAGCESCDEIVSLVLTTEAEVAAEPEATGVPRPEDGSAPAPLPFRPRTRRLLTWALPIAATLATVVLWRPWAASPLDVDGLTRGLRDPGRIGELGEVLEDHRDWRRYRGADAPATTDEEEAAFKTGVRLVDLVVALEGGDRPLAARVAADLARVLPGIELVDFAATEAERLRDRLGSKGDGSVGRDDVAALDRNLTAILDGERVGTYLRLGAWAEATRLGILMGVAPDAGAVRRTAGRFRDADFPEPIDDALAKALALAAGGLDPDEVVKLADELGTLVESGVEKR